MVCNKPSPKNPSTGSQKGPKNFQSQISFTMLKKQYLPTRGRHISADDYDLFN